MYPPQDDARIDHYAPFTGVGWASRGSAGDLFDSPSGGRENRPILAGMDVHTVAYGKTLVNGHR